VKFLSLAKDGGPDSRVWGYWLFEIKPLFSIVLLRFEDGAREVYHSHAFNSVSWVLKGELEEYHSPETRPDVFDRLDIHRPSIFPVLTFRDTLHKVKSIGRTWVISFRGPWANEWKEVNEETGEVILTNGRKVVG
jgi:hypothetical protein